MNAAATVMTETPSTSFGPQRCWEANIDLGFTARADKTVMSTMRFEGPMRVQRPFYPEGSPCHVYLLHPPGGMVSGDRLAIDIKVGHDAHTLLTTPSAGKIYRADSAQLRQMQTLAMTVEKGGTLEWLPQENILFDGANAHLDTDINLSENCRFIGWDMLSFGRKAGNAPFKSGALSQRFKILYGGKPLTIENFRLDPSLALLSSSVGLMGFAHIGNLYFVAAGIDSLRDYLKSVLPDSDNSIVIASTHKPNILLVRAFSHCSEHLRNTFYQIWGAMREPVISLPPSYPRIWST